MPFDGDSGEKHSFKNAREPRPLLMASIMTALAVIGYEGDFTFEADNFLVGFPKKLRPDAADPSSCL